MNANAPALGPQLRDTLIVLAWLALALILREPSRGNGSPTPDDPPRAGEVRVEAAADTKSQADVDSRDPR